MYTCEPAEGLLSQAENNELHQKLLYNIVFTLHLLCHHAKLCYFNLKAD